MAEKKSDLRRKAGQSRKLKLARRERTAALLRRRREADISASVSALQTTPTRKIVALYVLPLQGAVQILGDVSAATAFIASFDESKPGTVLARYEVGVRYSNGDEIRGQFNDKVAAVGFLRSIR